MKNNLQKTKMMAEAGAFGKKYSPLIETLIFLAVFYAGGFAQSFFLTPLMQMYFYSDKEILSIFSNPQKMPDFNVLKERFLSLLMDMPEWLLIANLFLTVCTILAVIIYCKAIEKRPLSSVGLRKGNIFVEYLIGFVIGAALMAFAVLMPVIANTVVFEKTYNISPLIFGVYLVAYMIQGMSEELLIRGYFMTALSKTSTPMYALICSSFFFAIMHSGNTGFSVISLINLFMFGLVSGMYVIKRGNIWGAAAMHAAWNFVQGIVFGISVSGTSKSSSVYNVVSLEGFDKLNGEVFGFEGGLWVTLVLFLALGVVIKLKQNEKEIAKEENDEQKAA